MTAEEIRRRREEMATAEPFQELSEIAAAFREHLGSVEAGAAKVANSILNGWHEDALNDGLVTVQEHVLDDYAKLRDELHAAIDRVMRAPLMDRPRTRAVPEPEAK